MNVNIVEKALFLESLAANAWRPVIVQHLDGWRMRYTGGTSGRVNTVWPNQQYGPLSLDERIEIIEDFYNRHGRPASFQMSPANLPENLHDELLARGYKDIKMTQMQTAPGALVLERTQPISLEVIESPTLTEAWFKAYTEASKFSAESLPVRRGILTRIGPRANFLMILKDGVPAAMGLGVSERGWVGIFNLITVDEFRRQGLASQVMYGLAAWGQRIGADNVYLQVMENNPPALAMYEKQGFKKVYNYWYSEKPMG